ncbi:hypothetical protein EDD15DRAFT_2340306 [Pisolithus albus]|nr:hypothetical protein EDD15DRAFT_2340306 [Pisolithus albus]
MVNYTIISGIPDTIFSSMLHLKSPLEKWDYLENCFGQIPRPESWLAAEQAMQQSDLSSKQTATEETGQEARDSNIELENSPDGEDDSQDIPDDCAETEAGHPKPEPNVVDARHLELYLLGVEVGTGDSKWLDEGTNVLEVPDKGSQCAGDEVEEDEGLPKLSSKALETQEALPFTTSERTETWTGHQKPKDEVVDMRHMVDVLPMFEVGSTGQAWYGKHVKELQAPDEGGQRGSDEVEESQDLPKSSSEAVKPEVADVQQVEDHLLEVEAQAVDSIQPDKHANMLEAPDESGLLSSKALEPEGDTTRQASGHSTEDARGMGVLSSPGVGCGDGMAVEATEPDKGKISNGYNDTVSRDITTLRSMQRALLIDRGCQHSECEMERPDDLPALHRLPSNGITDTPRMSRVSHQHSRINMKTVSVNGPQTRGYGCLIPSIPILLPCKVSRHLWNIADTFRRQDVPSRQTRSVNKASTVKMAVLQQQHETTRQDSEHMWLKHHDTASKDFVHSCAVEKILLAISRSQQGE